MADEVSRRAARTAAMIAVPLALIAGLLVFWALGGFNAMRSPSGPTSPGRTATGPQPTGPVSMSANALPADQAAACRALLAKLPATVRDLPRRPVTSGPEQNAAYGEPPLTLACGTTRPSFPAEATVYRLSGVCWYAAENRDNTAWTTVDRTIPVTVTVPRTYQAPGQWVIEFSGPVAATLPAAPNPPSGCTA